jgi:hypothetical protein
MGFGKPSAVKDMLKVRASSAWINKEKLESGIIQREVSTVLSDLLLDVHQFGNNPMLTYDILVKCTQNVVLRYIKAFPKLDAIVFLLDEQQFVPLGKVPTQDKRKKPLTAAERAKILDGGVISRMDSNLQETIENTYSKQASVKAGKATAFSVFFSKYIRTRELRKDLVVFIANCFMELITSGKVPETVSIYIDGMSVSMYYSSPDHLFKATEDEEGTPLVKRRRSASAVETINYHEEDDNAHLSVCKLVWTTPSESLMTLSLDHPYSSLSTGCSGASGASEAARRRIQKDDRKRVAPLWLSKEDGDSEMFMGYRGLYRRPNMGEADIKISYYVRRIAETLAHQMKNAGDLSRSSEEEGCMCYVSCWDSDVIAILLLCMKEIPPQVSRCFDVLLDTEQGGTCREMISLQNPVSLSEERPSSSLGSLGEDISTRDSFLANSSQNSTKTPKKKRVGTFSHALGRVVWDEEDEALTNIINIKELYRSIGLYFKELHPGVDNAVETLCLMLLLTGSDYVDSLPGVGMEKLRTTFDLGGYLWLSEAIFIRSETITSPPHPTGEGASGVLTKRFHVDVDEDKIKAFLNLVCRYAVPLHPMEELSKTMKRQKSKLTSDANKKEKAINALKIDDNGDPVRLTEEEMIEIENVEKEIAELRLQRDFLGNFLQQSTYINLHKAFSGPRGSKENLRRYIHETLGISHEDCNDWNAVEKGFEKARKDRVVKKRKALEKSAKTPEAKAKIHVMSDVEILGMSKKRDLTDIRKGTELDAVIRRVGWNVVYWTYSPFVCLRDTKHLNSMCRLDTGKHEGILSRAQEAKQKKKAGKNHRIEEYYDPKPYATGGTARKLPLNGSNAQGKRKTSKRLSLNGFTRLYEDSLKGKRKPSADSTTDASQNKKRRKVKISRSRDVFPASRVVINLGVPPVRHPGT